MRTKNYIIKYLNVQIKIVDVLQVCNVKTHNILHVCCPFCKSRNRKLNAIISINENNLHCFDCDNTWYPVSFYRNYKSKTSLDTIDDLTRIFNIDLSLLGTVQSSKPIENDFRLEELEKPVI